MFTNLLFKISILFTIFFSYAVSNSSFSVQELVNTQKRIWGMSFINDKEIIFTHKDGDIGVFHIDTKDLKYLNNTPIVLDAGQGGMLDVKISPDFDETNFIYFTYVKEVDGNGVTVLARAKYDGMDLKNWQELLVTKSGFSSTRHFGSRIAFDKDGHVFFGVGDRGSRDSAQDLTNHAGTIIRLNLDGTIPEDNPYVKAQNVLPEIYSYGVRNPQGIFYDEKRDILFEIEHGPRGGDEINIIEAGRNYGWPVISYGKEYWAPLSVGEGTHKEGMEQPIKVFTPSTAPSALIVYNGEKFKALQNKLLSTTLKLRHLNIVALNSNLEAINELRVFEDLGERLRSITESSSGDLYISTDSGKILKVEK